MLTTQPVRCPIALLRAAEVPHPERRVARGEIVKLRRGVYVDAGDWAGLAPWERYAARVHAVALAHPDVVFSHESASVAQGLGVFGDPVVVHVIDHPSATSRLHGGVRVHTASRDREIVEVGGILMTCAADTAVDLARFRHASIGVAAADAALRTDPTLTTEHLLGINEARLSKRGRALARWPLGFATAGAETVLESVSRAVIEWLGFPSPLLQTVFRSADGTEDRGDFHWPDFGLVGEADGDLKLDGRFGDPITLLRRQRARDARLRDRHAAAVAHWGWSDAVGIDSLRSLLYGHGLRPITTEHTAQLFSLRRALADRPPHRAALPAETASARRDRG